MSQAFELQQDEQMVVFRLDGESYGVGISWVSEIIRLGVVTPIPGTLGHVRGLVNLRGQTIPVIDLRVRLGLGVGVDSQASRVVVVEMPDGKVGLVVDEVREVAMVALSDVEAPPAMISEGFIRGVASLEGRLITLLDLEKALVA